MMPQMSPIHFRLLEKMMRSCGYRAIELPPVTTAVFIAVLRELRR